MGDPDSDDQIGNVFVMDLLWKSESMSKIRLDMTGQSGHTTMVPGLKLTSKRLK
jgi:hypothetical protein